MWGNGNVKQKDNKNRSRSSGMRRTGGHCTRRNYTKKVALLQTPCFSAVTLTNTYRWQRGTHALVWITFSMFSVVLHCRAPRKHWSWTSPVHVAFENGQALILFRQARKKTFYKISYQGFTRKQTLILVSPL